MSTGEAGGVGVCKTLPVPHAATLGSVFPCLPCTGCVRTIEMSFNGNVGSVKPCTGAVHTNPKRQRGRQTITSLTLRVSMGCLTTGRAQCNQVREDSIVTRAPARSRRRTHRRPSTSIGADVTAGTENSDRSLRRLRSRAAAFFNQHPEHRHEASMRADRPASNQGEA